MTLTESATMHQSSASTRQSGLASLRAAIAAAIALPLSFSSAVQPLRLPRRFNLPAGAGELPLVVLLALAFFIFSGEIGLSEQFHAWARGHESGQLDELPLTLLMLSIGLGGLALRHGRLTRQALARQQSAEMRVAELLQLNRQLAQNLIRAQENERGALARELHDEAGQCCAAIRAEASFLGHLAGADAVMSASAGRIGKAAQQMHGAVRGMLTRLRPPCLDSLGLVPALQEWCANWERQHGIACGFFPRALPARLDDASSVAVFRLVQEGLTNVARHSGADRVRIDLGCDVDVAAAMGWLRLVIEDNGIGMGSRSGIESGSGIGMPAGPAGAGFGLAGMRERVAGLGGCFTLDSAVPEPAPAGYLDDEHADCDHCDDCDDCDDCDGFDGGAGDAGGAARYRRESGVRLTASLPLCLVEPVAPGTSPDISINRPLNACSELPMKMVPDRSQHNAMVTP